MNHTLLWTLSCPCARAPGHIPFISKHCFSDQTACRSLHSLLPYGHLPVPRLCWEQQAPSQQSLGDLALPAERFIHRLCWGPRVSQEEEESPAEGSKDEPGEQAELKEEAEAPVEDTSPPPPTEPKEAAVPEEEKATEKENEEKPEAQVSRRRREQMPACGE